MCSNSRAPWHGAKVAVTLDYPGDANNTPREAPRSYSLGVCEPLRRIRFESAQWSPAALHPLVLAWWIWMTFGFETPRIPFVMEGIG